MDKQVDWFVNWFDSKYYHILYKDRDYKEAELFMDNLLAFLNLKKEARILDLACGKGRHSVYLSNCGFNVVGADLSKNSIQQAKKYENDTLKFHVHDMRDTFNLKFDAIFNLFTSFGYFKDDKTNITVLKNIKNGLLKNGVAVIDFLNINYVKKHLMKNETIIKNDIAFNIKREIKNNIIIKNITFKNAGKHHHFTEEVQGLSKESIFNFLKKAGLKVKQIFGDYYLNEFDSETSKRLIIIVEL